MDKNQSCANFSKYINSPYIINYIKYFLKSNHTKVKKDPIPLIVIEVDIINI